MKNFSTIGIFSKDSDDRVKTTLTTLHNFLIKEKFTVVAEENAAEYLGIDAIDTDKFCGCIDLAIVVGGDGTLLKAGRLLADKNVPVIGINLGRLGFLVDISPNEITKQLSQMLKGEYTLETRSLLYAEAFRGEERLGGSVAFNDVVLHVRNDIRMIEFTTHIDDKFVNTQRADGIVVATPTGSTSTTGKRHRKSASTFHCQGRSYGLSPTTMKTTAPLMAAPATITTPVWHSGGLASQPASTG